MKKMFSKKEKSENTDLPSGYEEQEKKTPFAGYILLIAMFIAALWMGWQALDDLARVPQQPEPLSACANEFVNIYGITGRQNVYQYRDYSEPPEPKLMAPRAPAQYTPPQCTFSALEREHGIPDLVTQKNSLEAEQQSLFEQKNEAEKTRANIQTELQALERQYGLSLLEKIANEETLTPPASIREQVETLAQEWRSVWSSEQELNNQLDTLEVRIDALNDTLAERYAPVAEEFENRWHWYEFWVFVMQMIAVIPFFYLVFRQYLRLYKKDSPYTIIFTALLAVASLLLLRVTLTWFWTLFLADLWQIIRESALLRSLVLYAGMLGAIAVFGSAVWLLQKKIFDPRRVALRRLRSGECPTCQTSLDLAETYCPNCGTEVKKKCASCSNMRFAVFRHCPHCGSKDQ